MRDSNSISAILYGWMRDGHLFNVDGDKLGFHDELEDGLEDGYYTFNSLQTDKLGYVTTLSYYFRDYDYDMKDVVARLRYLLYEVDYSDEE
jgi:hypothetical protein